MDNVIIQDVYSYTVHSAYKGYKKSKIDFLFFGFKLISDS